MTLGPLLALLACAPGDAGELATENGEVINTPGNWFLLDDYPAKARKQDMEGAVIIRATIGTDGRLHDCIVVQSSGFELLDKTTCELAVRRARYAPAKDQDGAPMESVYQHRVVWKLYGE